MKQFTRSDRLILSSKEKGILERWHTFPLEDVETQSQSRRGQVVFMIHGSYVHIGLNV